MKNVPIPHLKSTILGREDFIVLIAALLGLSSLVMELPVNLALLLSIIIKDLVYRNALLVLPLNIEFVKSNVAILVITVLSVGRDW